MTTSESTPVNAVSASTAPMATGERVIEAEYLTSAQRRAIYVMHIASYEYARPWCRDRDVLDLGCGTGYGAARLADEARSVLGVDIDPSAIAFASRTYRGENLQFKVVDASASEQLASESFDTILSFQVIEHIADDSAYLEEAHRLLRPGGVLILVTPDRRNRLFRFQRPWNRWHVREYDGRMLAGVLESRFEEIELSVMTADPEIADRELSRYRRTRWLLLPATLPGMPSRLRVFLLDCAHAIDALIAKTPDPALSRADQELDFDIDSVHFVASDPRSLNLVGVCRKNVRCLPPAA